MCVIVIIFLNFFLVPQDAVKMNQLSNLLQDALICTDHVQQCAIIRRKDGNVRASSVGFNVSDGRSCGYRYFFFFFFFGLREKHKELRHFVKTNYHLFCMFIAFHFIKFYVPLFFVFLTKVSPRRREENYGLVLIKLSVRTL